MTYAFIAERCSDLPISVCCRMMKVSTSGYYQRLAEPVTAREYAEAVRANVVFDVWKMSRHSYGMPRVRAEVRRGRGGGGVSLCEWTVGQGDCALRAAAAHESDLAAIVPGAEDNAASRANKVRHGHDYSGLAPVSLMTPIYLVLSACTKPVNCSTDMMRISERKGSDIF